jgi:pyruvate ferredoxin oxidoreductase alpha subunit
MIDLSCDLAAGKDVDEVTWVSYPEAQKEAGGGQ